ncbi:hypothetical protein HPP92_017912 [Vanilla planifolia]|uniref:Uncharacterized protein n=1 Tax=Vanilla planifolia TaxID=51239 RepID=A0A835QFC7_VANPL|nr:hypothetical protein HPP92_018489 [Vanilla planifolia]KAG0468584.1 hypothetical protein HPP92_017912 [Vanilla planifolia]
MKLWVSKSCRSRISISCSRFRDSTKCGCSRWARGEGKFGARKEEATFEDTETKSVKRKLSFGWAEEDVHRRKDKRDRSRKSAGHNGKPTASIRKKRARKGKKLNWRTFMLNHKDFFEEDEWDYQLKSKKG